VGLVLGGLAWFIALFGVHAYSAPRIQWLLTFPGNLLGAAGLAVHAVQWTGYAWLLVSTVEERRARGLYLAALCCVLGLHVVLGIATAGRV
jgi:hypothetical protein